MTTSLAGRMVFSALALVGLLLAVGYAFVGWLDAPIWFPMALAIGLVLVQYAINPWLIRWLVPAQVIPVVDGRYATEDPLGELVARRCRDAGVPLVRLGIVEDDTPKAFAFGRTPASAHVWISRGLLKRLDEDELDAVVCHELGHVRHWDMAVMTVAAVVPMVLYMTYLVARHINRSEARAVALGAFAAYVVAQVVVLAVSRVRELAADRWSCACTGNGNALASALVKIAYGIGVADADRARSDEKVGVGQARTQSMRVLGIMSTGDGKAMSALLSDPADLTAACAGLRWDRTSPWARLLEKLSTHPLVSTRIDVLARSGLAGAPQRWADEAWDAADGHREVARRHFRRQALMAVAPWAVLALALAMYKLSDTIAWRDWGFVAAGALLFAKQRMRYPFGHRPTERVTSLLERLDGSPVAGVPVEVRGRVLGRGVPGYVLSPDLVLADESGFVPFVYTNPIPFAEEWFALTQAEKMVGREVVARGWYFRGPGPWVELRDMRALAPPAGHHKGKPRMRARGWRWVVRHAAAVALFGLGIGLVLAHAGG